MALNTKPFDAADYLETEEDIAAYLNEAFSEGDPAAIAQALGTVARAQGVSNIARKMGVSRETVYQALSAQGNPTFSTFLRAMTALGFTLAVKPAR